MQPSGDEERRAFEHGLGSQKDPEQGKGGGGQVEQDERPSRTEMPSTTSQTVLRRSKPRVVVGSPFLSTHW